MTIFISSSVETSRIPTFQPQSEVLGRAHYSWKIIANMYQEALTACGYRVRELVAPDIYESDIAKQIVGVRRGDANIIVKPIEFLRPFFGVRNIAICGWEFPEFSTVSHNGNPRSNHVQMLSRMEDVWCWSSFTSSNLQQHGVNARPLPPPVAMFATDELEPIDSIPAVILDSCQGSEPETLMGPLPFAEVFDPDPKGRVFLCVINPWDKRKRIDVLLRAAVEALRPADRLIVKLIIDNMATQLGNINEILNIHYNLQISSSKVIFIGAQLSANQMNYLYSTSDFYISASSAEGLNLPLIEAMQRKLIPISIAKTAMQDYLSEKNAIILPAEQEATGRDFHSASHFLSTTHFPVSKEALKSGMKRAQKMTKVERTRMGANAQRTVSELYGLDRFRTELQRAF